MSGYLNLLMLGYLPWVIVDNLSKYVNIWIAIVIAIALITVPTIKSIKEKDFVSLVFVSGFLAYIISLLYNAHICELYSSNILLIVVVVAMLSVIIKKPFTIAYAKKTISADKWTNPLFIKINILISLLWSGIFLMEYIIKIIKLPNTSIISAALVILGIGISKHFPDYYKQKHIKKQN